MFSHMVNGLSWFSYVGVYLKHCCNNNPNFNSTYPPYTTVVSSTVQQCARKKFECVGMCTFCFVAVNEPSNHVQRADGHSFTWARVGGRWPLSRRIFDEIDARLHASSWIESRTLSRGKTRGE